MLPFLSNGWIKAFVQDGDCWHLLGSAEQHQAVASPPPVCAASSCVGPCSADLDGVLFNARFSKCVCEGFAIKLLSPWGRRRAVGGVTSVRAPVGPNSPEQPHLGPLPRTLCPSLRLRSGLSLQSFMKLPSCCCCLTGGFPSTWSFPHWCTTSRLHGIKRKNLRGRILLSLPFRVLAGLTCFVQRSITRQAWQRAGEVVVCWGRRTCSTCGEEVPKGL